MSMYTIRFSYIEALIGSKFFESRPKFYAPNYASFTSVIDISDPKRDVRLFCFSFSFPSMFHLFI